MPKRKRYDYPFGGLAKEHDDANRVAYRRGFRAGLRAVLKALDVELEQANWPEDADARGAVERMIQESRAKPPKRRSR